jgi:hypothetical protein
MVKPFYAEQNVEVEGETLRLVINFEAIDATETLLGTTYPSVLQALGQTDDPPLGFTAKVVWGLLRKYHPEMSTDQVMALMWGENGIRVGYAVQQLMEAAFPTAEETPAETKPRPRKPRGASKAS